jgi:putative ABC transport system ATP-binding protein
VGVIGPAVRAQWVPIAVGSVLAMLHQAAETAVPLAIGTVVDRAVVPGDGGAMLRWALVLIGLFLVLGTAGLYGYYLLELGSQRIAHHVRHRVVARVHDARGGIDARSGDTVSLASNDAEAVGNTSYAIGLGLAAIPPLVGGAAVLLAISVPLALVVLVGLPVVLGMVALLSRPLTGRMEAEQDAVASATGVATDLLRGLRVLKGLGVEDAATARYRHASREALSARLRSARFLGGYTGLTLATSGLFLVVVAAVGGRLALEGRISVGELVTAVGLAQFLAAPLRMVAEAGAMAAAARASAQRMRALLAVPPALEDALRPESPGAVRGELELRGVVAGPLAGLDLAIAAGEHVGVVASPAEAAALLDVLARRRDPEAGGVLLDGVAFPRRSLRALRRDLLVGDHDAVLFSGTLGENVAATARPGADLRPALDASDAAEVAAAAPDGLDARLDDGARVLSGGQRQRVALARALAADPPVLVLHDPTTAVDAATEHAVARRVARLRRGRTTVVVASSPALLDACDRVVLLDGGRVATQGAHTTLVADPRYRELVLG